MPEMDIVMKMLYLLSKDYSDDLQEIINYLYNEIECLDADIMAKRLFEKKYISKNMAENIDQIYNGFMKTVPNLINVFDLDKAKQLLVDLGYESKRVLAEIKG